jgi:hypothetical protein
METEIEFSQHDTILIVIKQREEKLPDILLRGILIECQNFIIRGVNEDNGDDSAYFGSNFDKGFYSSYDIRMFLNSNQFVKNEELYNGARISAPCKILPCRIVLIEKSISWIRFEGHGRY